MNIIECRCGKILFVGLQTKIVKDFHHPYGEERIVDEVAEHFCPTTEFYPGHIVKKTVDGNLPRLG